MLEDDLNKEFCKEVGIKPVSSYIINKDTGEVKFFTRKTAAPKLPTDWKNIIAAEFKHKRYPDLINNPYNFTALLNVQWFMFGELGDVYTRDGTESFEYKYVKTRLTAMKLAKSYGGGEMLEAYKKALRELSLDYFEAE